MDELFRNTPYMDEKRTSSSSGKWVISGNLLELTSSA
jgi:hypothetical protein